MKKDNYDLDQLSKSEREEVLTYRAEMSELEGVKATHEEAGNSEIVSQIENFLATYQMLENEVFKQSRKKGKNGNS